MKKQVVAIGVGVSLMAGGCGSNEKRPETKDTVQSQANELSRYTIAGPPKSFSVELQKSLKEDMVVRSLTKFRLRIAKEKRARVVLGACMVWSSGGGITAVMNPGVVEGAAKQGGSLSFNVFIGNQGHGLGEVLPFPYNGPVTVEDKNGRVVIDETPNIGLVIFDGKVSVETRNLEDYVEKNQAGHLYYLDKETGEALISTAVTPLPLNGQNIELACNSLKNSTPIPVPGATQS